jgi:hypothetical protein
MLVVLDGHEVTAATTVPVAIANLEGQDLVVMFQTRNFHALSALEKLWEMPDHPPAVVVLINADQATRNLLDEFAKIPRNKLRIGDDIMKMAAELGVNLNN